MVGKYKVITLCGSTRFKDAFMETQKRLTLEGNIVIMRSFLIIQNVSSWTTKKFLMPIIQGTRQRKRLSNLSCQMGKNKSEC